MIKEINFVPITRDNWEKAIELEVNKQQKKFVPSAAESIASAYIKPWDEALDPYAIMLVDKMIGLFYISYTPESIDNYWIGGFFIDKNYQDSGYGKSSLCKILRFIPTIHPNCREMKLTVEEENSIARKLYENLEFVTDNKVNKYGEIIYSILVKDIS
ncbi:MAG: GNAT family N-acetyltransferase [candidate division Zixibacteria bacterium]|nr:GNAT family N-acetyltransferase [candidate division Zixibacteria bacterium]